MVVWGVWWCGCGGVGCVVVWDVWWCVVCGVGCVEIKALITSNMCTIHHSTPYDWCGLIHPPPPSHTHHSYTIHTTPTPHTTHTHTTPTHITHHTHPHTTLRFAAIEVHQTADWHRTLKPYNSAHCRTSVYNYRPWGSSISGCMWWVWSPTLRSSKS